MRLVNTRCRIGHQWEPLRDQRSPQSTQAPVRRWALSNVLAFAVLGPACSPHLESAAARRASSSASRTTHGSSPGRARSTRGSRYLQRLGVDLVRVNVRWNDIALRRPARADEAHRPRVSLGSGRRAAQRPPHPRHHARRDARRDAEAGQTAVARPNWAPTKAGDFANFAFAAAERYPYVHHWLIWNEPNKNWSFRPTTPANYVRLLNAGYAAIKRVNPGDAIGGGVTAPRGGTGDVSPIDWIHGMRAAGARLDAYAHHPYPVKPKETPSAAAAPRARR